MKIKQLFVETLGGLITYRNVGLNRYKPIIDIQEQTID